MLRRAARQAFQTARSGWRVPDGAFRMAKTHRCKLCALPNLGNFATFMPYTTHSFQIVPNTSCARANIGAFLPYEPSVALRRASSARQNPGKPRQHSAPGTSLLKTPPRQRAYQDLGIIKLDLIRLAPSGFRPR